MSLILNNEPSLKHPVVKSHNHGSIQRLSLFPRAFIGVIRNFIQGNKNHFESIPYYSIDNQLSFGVSEL